jgi:hypothetical protein
MLEAFVSCEHGVLETHTHFHFIQVLHCLGRLGLEMIDDRLLICVPRTFNINYRSATNIQPQQQNHKQQHTSTPNSEECTEVHLSPIRCTAKQPCQSEVGRTSDTMRSAKHQDVRKQFQMPDTKEASTTRVLKK